MSTEGERYAWNALMLDSLHKMPGYCTFVNCPPCTEVAKLKYGASYKETMALWMLHGCIIHLNDKHKWTREEIADWLESLPEDEYNLSFKENDGT